MLPFSEFQTIIFDMLEVNVPNCDKERYSSIVPRVEIYARGLISCKADENIVKQAISLGINNVLEQSEVSENGDVNAYEEIVWGYLRNKGQINALGDCCGC